MTDACGPEARLQGLALGGGSLGEAAPQLGIARVDSQLPPGLGVDEPQLADIGELLLTGIANLGGEARVPPG